MKRSGVQRLATLTPTKLVATGSCTLALLINANHTIACPAFVSAKTLPTTVTDAAPNSIRLFKFVKGTTGSQWSSLPIQIDPLTNEGVIDNKRARPEDAFKIAPEDRVVFETKTFGDKYDHKTALPCAARHVTEIESLAGQTNGSFAYIMTCADTATAPKSMGPLVTHDPKTKLVNTERFAYEYQPTNQLLFKTLTAHMSNGKDIVAGHNSDFVLHMDLKRFFTMNFGNKNVESYVESTHSGDVGISAVVNFYLRVLLFKVDMKMATMASFFRDSTNIPMIVDVPLPAPNHLNPGSGMLYTFKPEGTKFNLTPGTLTVPLVNPERIKKGYEEVARDSESTCTGESCVYRVTGNVESKTFNIDIVIPRHAVQKGFYPQLVTDVPKFKKDMNWNNPSDDDEGRFGFYYENSGLPQGRFTMNYWIGFTDGPAGGTCPSPVDVKETISGQDIVDAQAAKGTPTH